MNLALRLLATTALAGFCFAAPLMAQSQFLDLASTSPSGSYLAGQQAMGSLRTPEAARYLGDAAIEEWNNPLVVSRAFVAFAANGEIPRAADMARRMLELEPGNQLARVVVATEALKNRRYAAAQRDLEKLGVDSFEGITGAILRAWALVGDGRPADASKSLDAIARGGLEEFLVFHRAIMAEVAGNSAQAQDYINQAVETDAYSPDVVEAYARIFGNAGKFDEALDIIVRYEARGLTHPIIVALKQQVLAKQRPAPFADSVQSGAAQMFHSVGLAFAREGTNDISLVLERLAQYLNPRNDTIPIIIGQLYDGAGQHELANAIYEAVPAKSLLKPMATVRVADNLDALGDRSEAIRRLTNIVTTNAEDVDAISVLGDLLRSDKQYVAAADAYTKALAVTGGASPGDWRFYYVRGIANERADRFEQAEADFLKALDLNPNQPQVLNYLGYSWVDKGLHLDRALGMIEKAIEGAPNDGYIIDSLGWAYYRLGRFDEAVVKLEQAALLRPADPEINDHLGDAYWRVGRKLEASFQWKLAFAMDKEGNVKDRITPKLAGGLDAAPVTKDSAPVEAVPEDQGSAS